MNSSEVQLRVRYAETDAMGVAHHSSYVPWLEVARIEWLRINDLSYRTMESQGLRLPVTRCELTYRRSAEFDDELVLITTAKLLGRAQVQFSTDITRAGELLAQGVVDLACINQAGRPQRLPEQFCTLIEVD